MQNFMNNISQEKIGSGNLTPATDWLHGFPFTLIKNMFYEVIIVAHGWIPGFPKFLSIIRGDRKRQSLSRLPCRFMTTMP